MNPLISTAITAGSWGYYGYKKSTKPEVSKNLKRLLIYTPIAISSAIGVYEGKDLIDAFYQIANSTGNWELRRHLANIYQEPLLAYSIGGLFGLSRGIINGGVGYLIGRGIGKVKKGLRSDQGLESKVNNITLSEEKRINILKDRFARGEITKTEYFETLKILE